MASYYCSSYYRSREITLRTFDSSPVITNPLESELQMRSSHYLQVHQPLTLSLSISLYLW